MQNKGKYLCFIPFISYFLIRMESGFHEWSFYNYLGVLTPSSKLFTRLCTQFTVADPTLTSYINFQSGHLLRTCASRRTFSLVGSNPTKRLAHPVDEKRSVSKAFCRRVPLGTRGTPLMRDKNLRFAQNLFTCRV